MFWLACLGLIGVWSALLWHILLNDPADKFEDESHKDD